MKHNKIVYLGAGGDPNGHVLPAISIPTGKRKVVLLKTAPEGRVERVYVKQLTGTSRGFTVRIVESILPYGDEDTNADYNAATGCDPEHFDVVGVQTVTAGNPVNWRDSTGAGGLPFVNQDSETQTNRERKLYLVIIPDNSVDTTTWEATILFNTQQT